MAIAPLRPLLGEAPLESLAVGADGEVVGRPGPPTTFAIPAAIGAGLGLEEGEPAQAAEVLQQRELVF